MMIELNPMQNNDVLVRFDESSAEEGEAAHMEVDGKFTVTVAPTDEGYVLDVWKDLTDEDPIHTTYMFSNELKEEGK